MVTRSPWVVRLSYLFDIRRRVVPQNGVLYILVYHYRNNFYPDLLNAPLRKIQNKHETLQAELVVYSESPANDNYRGVALQIKGMGLAKFRRKFRGSRIEPRKYISLSP